MSEVRPRVRSKAQASTRGRLGDIWYVDEVFVKIGGERHYLWRAVDQDGDVIDVLVQRYRNARAAERFFRKLLKGQGSKPWLLVTDKLRSYGAAHRRIMPSVDHNTERYANNLAEVLASADTTARGSDARVQISGAGPSGFYRFTA